MNAATNQKPSSADMNANPIEWSVLVWCWENRIDRLSRSLESELRRAKTLIEDTSEDAGFRASWAAFHTKSAVQCSDEIDRLQRLIEQGPTLGRFWQSLSWSEA